jgi:hypothetical protein
MPLFRTSKTYKAPNKAEIRLHKPISHKQSPNLSSQLIAIQVFNVNLYFTVFKFS